MELQLAYRALRKASVRRGLDLRHNPEPHPEALAAVERAERLPAGSLTAALAFLRARQRYAAQRNWRAGA